MVFPLAMAACQLALEPRRLGPSGHNIGWRASPLPATDISIFQEAPGHRTKLQNHRQILIYIECESYFGSEAYEFLTLRVQYIRDDLELC